ncbi:MAG: HlyC/CorC family transporter [Clostridia bacterium]|nr:HlyC/CorC family transporter [Clostridia bacterium]
MDDHILWQIILQLVLIGLNAVFACAEIAVISMSDAKLSKLAEDGDRRATKLQKLTAEPARFLATIQVAITLSGFLGSAFAADNFAGIIVDALINAGVPESARGVVDTAAVVVVTLILSYFTLVLGELVPKRLAQKNSEKLALGMASLISFISKLFAPIVWILTASTNVILRLFGIDPNAEEEAIDEEEILMMVDASSDAGEIAEDEKEMIQNIFEFDDITAEEICTHRTEIDLLWMEDDLEEWGRTINDSRRSLYPVCGESVDDIIGILNAKAYFRMGDATDKDLIMEQAVRAPYFVSKNTHADAIFRKMQSTRNHFAVVLDDQGGTVGILTMNDLLEQIVGDLDDDHTAEVEEEIVHMGDNVWKIKGSASLDDVVEEIGVPLEIEDEDIDTFGGLVFGSMDEIPDDGETPSIEIGNMSVDVKVILDHKLVEAIVTVTPPETEDDDDEDKKSRKSKKTDDEDEDDD